MIAFFFGQSPFFSTEIRAGGMWNGRRTWKREWMTDMAKVSESSSFIDPVVCMKRPAALKKPAALNTIVQGGLVDLIPMNVIVQGGVVDLIPMNVIVQGGLFDLI